jgi:hypothetical protein
MGLRGSMFAMSIPAPRTLVFLPAKNRSNEHRIPPGDGTLISSYDDLMLGGRFCRTVTVLWRFKRLNEAKEHRHCATMTEHQLPR